MGLALDGFGLNILRAYILYKVNKIINGNGADLRQSLGKSATMANKGRLSFHRGRDKQAECLSIILLKCGLMALINRMMCLRASS